ncbi:MAG: DUF6364 family protein [Gemmatimonadaceae bacterium]|nr:DUF6364 family protein [Gemmatimonadaceae bacterium]
MPKSTRPSATPTRRTTSPRQAKNLLLDPDAIARGEAYSREHDTTMSQLVSDFLRNLPVRSTPREYTPAVTRLRGVAAGARTSAASHKAHLRDKYDIR